MSSNTPPATPASVGSAAELNAWLAKYEPVERNIIRSRERRLANAARKRERLRRQFGDLCEASEGLAVRWRRDGASVTEMLEYADDDVLMLRALLPFLRRAASERINAVRRQLTRPLYYKRENERRRELAAERRRIRKRITENACPTREEVLDAWLHVRDGRDEMLRFGSILEDLECYVDNQLRFVDGTLVGRGAGIKGWLRENIPALALKYTTVMKYKAAAKKLRQIVELRDPIPLAAVLDTPKNEVRDYSAEKLDPSNTASREVMILRARAIFLEVFEAKTEGMDATCGGNPGEKDTSTGMSARGMDVDQGEKNSGVSTGSSIAGGNIAGGNITGGNEVHEDANVRLGLVKSSVVGRGETTKGGKCTMAAVLARIDTLLDPEMVEEATMLAHWRRRYTHEITLRTKHRWRKILSRRVC